MSAKNTNLASLIAHQLPGEGSLSTAIPGLSLHRWQSPSLPANLVYEPRVCVVAQGAKRIFLGEDSLDYGPGQALLSSVHMPSSVQITQATPKKPFLGLTLNLDFNVLSRLLVASHQPAPRVQRPDRGLAVGELTPALQSAFQRLLGLLEEPRDIPVLAPIIQQEIFYRLLVGDLGTGLRQIAAEDSQGNQIARAITWMQAHFSEPLKVAELAGQANMSVSAFHQHFRTVTTMSPLQYQKWLRLNEARRLMLSEALDAGAAAVQVGYASSSQFSREYSRLFGAPPLRDIMQLRREQGDGA